MASQTFQLGGGTFAAEDSPGGRYSAVFEDDGETGYFYALDLESDDILDAVHVYNVPRVADRKRQSSLSVIWSGDGLRCALLINGYPRAALDFAAQRGFSRTQGPTFAKPRKGTWPPSDHSWSEDAIAWLDIRQSA